MVENYKDLEVSSVETEVLKEQNQNRVNIEARNNFDKPLTPFEVYSDEAEEDNLSSNVYK